MSKCCACRSVTPSPVSNNIKIEHRRSGSYGELPTGFVEDVDSLAGRKYEAEIRRNQVMIVKKNLNAKHLNNAVKRVSNCLCQIRFPQ